MLKIDIISGFLGAGKTTFIRRLLDTSLKNEKVILIENEYGEVSVDSDILNDTNIEIKELSQGCICCSLVGDFAKSLNEVITKYNPDRILIEPSGVGKLSDVVKAVKDANLAEYVNSLVCLVDAKKAKMYNKNFGEFFVDQIENAHTVILSRTDVSNDTVVQTAVDIIRSHNEKCVVVTTPISNLSDEELLNAYEGVDMSLLAELEEEHEHEHHHHHHDHDEECTCGCHEHHHHDDDDDDDEDEHEHHHHHHHDHDEECTCGCHDHHHHDDDDDDDEDEHEHHHHHHHDHDEECTCGCHEHHHHDDDDDDDEDEHEHHHHHHDHGEECTCGCHDHHHHHADEVFNSVGFETVKKYDMASLKTLLDEMAEGMYGIVVRAKGIVAGTDGKWYVFNLTPEEVSIEESKAIPMGKIAVIGSHIDEAKIKALF